MSEILLLDLILQAIIGFSIVIPKSFSFLDNFLFNSLNQSLSSDRSNSVNSKMFFLFILTVGFIYEWKNGALDWE